MTGLGWGADEEWWSHASLLCARPGHLTAAVDTSESDVPLRRFVGGDGSFLPVASVLSALDPTLGLWLGLAVQSRPQRKLLVGASDQPRELVEMSCQAASALDGKGSCHGRIT